MSSASAPRLVPFALALCLFATACSSSADSQASSESTSGVAGTESSVADEEADTTTVATTTTIEAPPLASSFDEITTTVDAFVTDRGLEGAGVIIVERDEGVLYEQYFGSFDADRISMIASSSKMIAAGVLLSLQEDGVLDMDASVESQVDWATGNPDITPAQLLSNSSGLVGLGPNLLYGPYLCQWGVPGTLQECGEIVFSTADDDGDQIEPDTEFRYGGAQWQVAGAVAESVSGKSWDALVDDLYAPCDVDSLGFISLGAVLTGAPGYPVAFGGDPSSVTESANPNVEGGAFITTGDYAKLLLMHLRGGECDGTAVLSQASLDTMHADRISAIYDGDARDSDTGYGMGWWVDRLTGRISDPGAWGAVPWLDLDDGYGAYIIVEDETSTGIALKEQIEELVHTAVVDG